MGTQIKQEPEEDRSECRGHRGTLLSGLLCTGTLRLPSHLYTQDLLLRIYSTHNGVGTSDFPTGKFTSLNLLYTFPVGKPYGGIFPIQSASS